MAHEAALMDRIVSIYREADTDGDGFLSQQEVVHMLTSIGMTSERAVSLFQLADHDNSGSVDFEEFCAWLFLDNVKSIVKPTVDKGEMQSWDVKALELHVGDVICASMLCPDATDCTFHVEFDPPSVVEEIMQLRFKSSSNPMDSHHVIKFKCANEGTCHVQISKVLENQDEHTNPQKQTEMTFVLHCSLPPPETKGKKPEWFVFSSATWTKVDAKDMSKVCKKIGQENAKDFSWLPDVYEPKQKKLHVQATYCFNKFVDKSPHI